MLTIIILNSIQLLWKCAVFGIFETRKIDFKKHFNSESISTKASLLIIFCILHIFLHKPRVKLLFSSKSWLLTCCQQRIRYGIKNCKIYDIVNVSPKPFPGIFIFHRRLVLFWRRPFLFLIIIKGVSSALSHPFP